MDIFADSFEFDGEHLDLLAVNLDGDVIQIISYDKDLDNVAVMVNNHVANMSIEEANDYIRYWL